MSKNTAVPLTLLARLLAPALGLALSGTMAQAADLATATASVSNLRYRLIDLDPNDGIAPTVTFSGNLVGQANTTTKVTTNGVDYFGAPYTSTNISQNPDDLTKIVTAPLFGQTGTLEVLSTLPGAKASLGPALSASTGLSASAINDSLITSSYSNTYSGTSIDYSRGDNLVRPYTTSYTNTSAAVEARHQAQVNQQFAQSPGVTDPDTGWTSDPVQLPNVTLSANTLLVIEGTANIGLYMDQVALDAATRAALGDFTADGRYGGYYGSSTDASVNVSIGSNPNAIIDTILPGGTVVSNQQSNTFSMSNSSDFFAYDGVNGTQNTNDTQTFAVSFANLGSISVQKVLSIDVSANTNVSGSLSGYQSVTTWGDPISDVPVPTPTPTPGIPEPSTYALMGLGLVGIVVASRRQRPTHRV